MPEETLTLLFSHIDPLYELHAAFLKDIEQRMATWYVWAPCRKNSHNFSHFSAVEELSLKSPAILVLIFIWLATQSKDKKEKNVSFAS